MKKIIFFTFLFFLFGIGAFNSSVMAADLYYYPTNKTNFKKVFISPADHAKSGCNGFVESTNALATAKIVATNLQAMGYTVRIGVDGDYATRSANSNSWGPNLHVPLHSNATTSYFCTSTDSTKGGTWILYDGSKPTLSSKATTLLNALGAHSPGTNDKIVTDTANGGSLYELRNSTTTALYVELAFHTYGPDQNWMTNSRSTAAQRLTTGIHNVVGGADCRTSSSCGIAGLYSMPIEEVNEIVNIVPLEEVIYNIKELGEYNMELVEKYTQLFNDEKFLLYGLVNNETINGVYVDNKGTAYVDFKNFAAFGPVSSAQRESIMHALNEIVFSDDTINKVYYMFDSNLSDWANWLESTIEPYTRN